jgi:hypothetical protein
LKITIGLAGVLGFGLASAFALLGGWTLPEFCWSTWLAGLVYTWALVTAVALRAIFSASSDRAAYEARFPEIKRISSPVFRLGVVAISISLGLVALYAFSLLFGFYGLFLSVFAEMEPHDLFGSNGFINSDFFTPVLALAERFWPMTVGVLIANWEDFVRRDSVGNRLRPLQAEVVRMHVMVLLLPFLSLAAWALLGEGYQPLAIVLLTGVLFLPQASREAAK